MEKLSDFEKRQMKELIIEAGLVKRESGGNFKRILIAMIGIVAIGIPALGLTFPALAEHIPIIGGIFERSDLHEQQRLVEFSNYATPIGDVQYFDGVSISLIESVFDSERVYLTYLIETDQAIEELDDAGVLFRDFSAHIVVDGVESSMSTISLDNFFGADRYSQIVIARMTPHINIDVGSEVTVDFNISQLIRASIVEYDSVIAEGVWNFSAPLDNLGRSIVEVNQRTIYEGYELNIYELTHSPLGIRINFSATTPIAMEPSTIEDDSEVLSIDLLFHAVDNLGNTMDRTTTGWSNDYDPEIGHQIHGSQSFTALHKDATQIIITPVIFVMSEIVTSSGSLGMETKEIIELEPFIIDLSPL